METTTINLWFCRLNQFQMIYKTYFTFFHPSPAIFFTLPFDIYIIILLLYIYVL